MARPKSYEEMARDIILHSKAQTPIEAHDVEMEIFWQDGQPTLLAAKRHISQDPPRALKELMAITLDMPYTGPDTTLAGKTNGEAILINLARQAANGCPSARKELLDRYLGAPTQRSENLNITGGLTEFLDKVAEDTRRASVTVVDASPCDPEEPSCHETDDL